MVESSDKMWSPGEGNGKPLQYSCLEKPHEQDEQYEKAKITKRQIIVCQLETQVFLQSDIEQFAIMLFFAIVVIHCYPQKYKLHP